MKVSSVQEQATEWLVRLQTAKDIDSHWPEFEAWLDKDPRHSKAYANVERLWSDFEFLQDLARKPENLSPKVLMRIMLRESKRRRLRMAVRISGVALLTLGAAALLTDPFRSPVDQQTWVLYERGADQVTPVTLDDGSSVQLNDNTHIRIGSRGRAREVLLDNGEAYFEVKPQDAEPFGVNAGTVMIRSQGAAFTIRREGNGHVETIVVRGSLEVTSIEPRQAGFASHAPLRQEVSASQIATISPSNQLEVMTLRRSELERRLAWTNNVHPSEVPRAEDSASIPHDTHESPVADSLDNAHLSTPYPPRMLARSIGSVD